MVRSTGLGRAQGAAVSHFIGGAAVVLLAACSVVGLGGETRPVPWKLTEVSGNELAVEAQYGGSSCTEFDQWRVDESNAEVKLLAMVRFDDGDGACTDDLVYETGSVRLDAPLGDRRLTGCDPTAPDAGCQ